MIGVRREPRGLASTRLSGCVRRVCVGDGEPVTGFLATVPVQVLTLTCRCVACKHEETFDLTRGDVGTVCPVCFAPMVATKAKVQPA